MPLSKSDLYDADVYDAPELNTDSTVVYLTTTVTSTVATNTVNVGLPSDGEGILTSRDHPVQIGDKADITGTSGGTGNGTFTVAVVVSDSQFTTVETIAASTGGSVNFRYPSGASNIGFDPTSQNVTTKNLEQGVLTDLSNHDLLNNEPVGTGVTYSNTTTGGKVTQEIWVKTSNSFTIRQIDYTYTGTKVTTEVRKVFSAADGTTVIAQITLTYSYTGSAVTGETIVRNV
jgi:hypothetical protein